jgi:hypothetical protein
MTRVGSESERKACLLLQSIFKNVVELPEEIIKLRKPVVASKESTKTDAIVVWLEVGMSGAGC